MHDHISAGEKMDDFKSPLAELVSSPVDTLLPSSRLVDRLKAPSTKWAQWLPRPCKDSSRSRFIKFLSVQFSPNGAVNPIATAATGGEWYQASAVQIWVYMARLLDCCPRAWSYWIRLGSKTDPTRDRVRIWRLSQSAFSRRICRILPWTTVSICIRSCIGKE